jgi:uncharacterized protein (TIGR02145 family)
MTAGVAGTVTFAVTTANISNGNYTVTVANLPTGVTVQGQVTISSNAGTLTLEGDATTIAGVTSNLQLTIDGATSGNFTLTIISSTPTVCPAQVYDAINDIYYDVMELVGLCWMKENLRSVKYQNGSDIPFAQPYYHPLYPDIAQHRIDFGLLYTWYSAMNISRAPGSDICPLGWRLPTSAEWLSLNTCNHNELRNTLYWLQPNDYTGDNTGFDIRAAGVYNSASERFERLYGQTAFWSSDAEVTTGYAAILRYNCLQIEILEITKDDAVSVRCVME